MHRKGLGMPIAQFVDDSEFDPETKRVMDAQFEMARKALQLGDERKLANERIAGMPLHPGAERYYCEIEILR